MWFQLFLISNLCDRRARCLVKERAPSHQRDERLEPSSIHNQEHFPILQKDKETLFTIENSCPLDLWGFGGEEKNFISFETDFMNCGPKKN